MCGIAAYLNFKQRKSISDFAGHLASGIAHRGPDGIRSYEDEQGRFLFIHSLLKIMDRTDAARQPVRDEQGNVLIYNGSIYNYKELQKKYNISSSLNDTLTLLLLLRSVGPEVLSEIEGMFALVYFSAQDASYIVARDRYGEKPLFYATCPLGNLVLASERKSIWNIGVEKQVNKFVALDFLLYHQLGNLSGLYHHIQAVPPGHYAVLRDESVPNFIPIHYPENYKGTENWDALMRKSVELTHIADFPIAHTLSGGIDSSGLLSYVVEKGEPEVFSFTAPNYARDEQAATQKSADYLGISQVQWVEFPQSPKTIIEDWARISRIHEEPLASPSSMAQYYVYQQVSDQGFRVLLEGQGSDEHYCGYNWYFAGLLSDGAIPLSYLMSKASAQERKTYRKWRLHKYMRFLYNRLYKSKGKRLAKVIHVEDKLWKEYAKGLQDSKFAVAREGVKSQMTADRRQGLFQYILRAADRSSMYHNVEVRLPFLYSHIIEQASALSDAQYWEQGYYKAYLREQLQGRIPADILTQKAKIGFEAPYGRIIESKKFKEVLVEATLYLQELGWLKKGSKLLPTAIDTDTYNLMAWKIVALYFAIR